MRVKRTKGLCAKFTHAEYTALEALAAGQPMGAWVREQLLAISARPGTEETLLSEIVALRTILVNLHFAYLRGDRLTAEEVQKLIDRADHDKLRKARARLAAGNEASPS